ncbi:hypothetical protein EUGRSUZ_K01717 [Eucalyptus grandis]|uniref:Uncharacterized protein n=2 Tax=Eucalyptus grandis TaxID=71139 RepID=A0A059A3S6_EUCGR|nr:hypothetical protein EUGRSUZ_K01717 [Eucalyptus grandis]
MSCMIIEDLLDGVHWEALRKKLNGQQRKYGKVRHFFSCSNPFAFHLKMGKKISAIGGRLKQMVGEIEGFRLSKRACDGGAVGVRVREMKPNLARGFDPIIGRDADKDKIIELLMQQDPPRDGVNLSMIPIVGVGGLGKTALTSLVFNDDRVQEHFALTVWSKLGQSLNNLDYPQLQTLLRGIISRCRLSLVLDDVQKMNRAGWDRLRSQLAEAADGTKVIVTTAFHMKTMSLFKTWAFAQNEREMSQRLLQIEDEIVGRCMGVPLVVRMLGGLLMSQTEEDILCILKLCYIYLPSHLKQCFALCSVFRGGCIILNFDIAYFWTACGLIPPSNENGTPEDTCSKYLKELWSRSFLQEPLQSCLSLNFKMHDLLYDLALSRIHISLLQTVSSGQLKENEAPSFSSRLKSNSVQMICCESQDTFNTRDVECEYLRFMEVPISSYEELPSSIVKLKHLKVLCLRGNCRMKKLPDATCKLRSLLLLFVSRCSELEEVPQDINRMINLRFLSLTTKQKSLESGIHRMMSLICNFQNLEVLFGGTSLVIEGCDKLILTQLEDNESDLIPKLCFFTVSASPLLVYLPLWLLASADTLEELYINDFINLMALPEWLQDLTHLKKLHIFECP